MALELKEVRLPRDNFELNISADVNANVTGIFGSSGAGKTSLMHLLAGLERPTGGSITFNGRELANADTKKFVPMHKRRIGMVFQEARLFPHMTVKKNLLFGQKYLSSDRPRPDFDEIVDMLELRHLLNSRPGNISGGESQRVALARALLCSPELLLLDEPFSAVDFALRKNIFPFLWRIRTSLGIPMLVISHDLPDILKLTDNLLLVDHGQVAGHGPISSLVLEKSSFNLIKDSGIVSVLDMEVMDFEDSDAVILSPGGQEKEAFKLYASHEPDLKIGQSLKVSIAPEDVILCEEPVFGTSARNMLPGTIIRAVEAPGRSICLIDIGAGQTLFAEVTRESFKSLDITPGNRIYCMIKANSVILSKV